MIPNISVRQPRGLEDLLEAAAGARENAYAPYSGFRVGAAVRTAGGEVYLGANVENASYGLTICAERSAIFNAIAHGHTRLTQLAVIANITREHEVAAPCGACRQVMAEFMHQDDLIITGTGSYYSLQELFPMPFRLKE